MVNELKDWKLVSKGFYRYVIAANVCYEIHIMKEYTDKSTLDATASLYITGDWHDATQGVNYFEREHLYSARVSELLDFAKKDYEENMS
jgi:hypothetical protein